MSKREDKQEKPEQVVDAAVRRASPGLVVTGWVLVQEVMDAERGLMLRTLTDDQMTPWRARGMLMTECELAAPAPWWTQEGEG